MKRSVPILIALGLHAVAAEPSPADLDFFEKRIRPVLTEHCTECHGEKKQKGSLRLDSRAAALAGGDLGPAIVPGEPKKSTLIEAVEYHNDDLQMPPKKKLADAAIADLVEWVKRGAPWPGSDGAAPVAKTGAWEITAEHRAHWAFQPVKKRAVPGDANQHPIDAFLREKLRAAQLDFAPPADKRTLLRRVTFDLTGLPPTPEEVEAFLADESPEAYEKVVARLLASPHYGERYARHWLDVARYSDSNGSEVDHAMANAWRYRDYVVAAMNDDKPFDQFVREQVAGDLLPGVGTETLAATGFLMLGPKALADLDKPKLEADIIDEQIDTIGRAFMGLTVGCARCHDHKFDPFSDEDYYALAGIFKSTRTMADYTKRVVTWNERPLTPADAPRVEALVARIAELKAERDAAGAAKPRPALAKGDAFLLIEAEDFTRGNVRVDTDSLGKGIGVIRTRQEYPDHIDYEFDLPEAGEYQLELRYAAKESRPTELSVNNNLEDMNACAEVTGEWKPGAQRWFVQGRYKFKAGRNTLTFHREGPVPLFDKILIGRPSAEPHSRNVPAAPAVKLAAKNYDKKKIDAEIAAAQRELDAIPTVMAPDEGKVADAPLLVRGNPATPGAIIPRGFVSIVGDLGVRKPGKSESGRRELADWLTRPEHPLTARVIVNRVWLWHFGEGLMRSPDNFGLRGEKPSHPELIDWLASWFMENGWSLKKLHTLICTSEAYGQGSTRAPRVVSGAPAGNTSTAPGEAAVTIGESGAARVADKSSAGAPKTTREARVLPDLDPDNRLLSHFPRRRLSGEELRDAMLAVSGQLDRTLGGSVMTVLNRTYAAGGNAPPDIAKQMHYDTPRRSLYLPIIRSNVHDMLAVFDYPDPGMLTGQRAETTVAPQALFLMNSSFVREQAAALARRVEPLGDDDAARVKAAYSLAFARPPANGEIERALAFLEREWTAAETLRTGAARREEKDARSPWTRFCHALLASNEFLYVH